MIFKRPILSDSQPKTMKNGVPSTSDAPINVYAVTPPAPVGKLRRCQPAGEAAQADNDQREEESERRSRLDPRGIVAALPFRRMLGHVGCGAAVFAAEREALEQPQRHQENRRSPS